MFFLFLLYSSIRPLFSLIVVGNGVCLNLSCFCFEGMKKMGRRPEQPGQPGPQQQGGQGEGRPPADRRPDRRPPRERRFDKPADEKPAEGGEFSVEK